MNKKWTTIIILAGLCMISLTHSYSSYDINDKKGDKGNTVFVTTQGGNFISEEGDIVAINTSTGEKVWEHDKYDLYYDIDIINESTIFFIANREIQGDSILSETKTEAVLMSWKSEEVYENFEVPIDTHDADYLGNNRYLVADIKNKAFIYNVKTEEKLWEYNFSNHYPRYPKSGGMPISNYEGWTHLNDIDSVLNGKAILMSPRNFNRVILVNKSNKENIFTLGKQEKTEILHKQHNPSLISKDPYTILVANSEKDTVEEYQLNNGDWIKTWSYAGELSWPRDADRLPTGETLIVDSEGQRVMKVRSDRSTVWKFNVRKMPYDAEILEYGEEPQGPKVSQKNSQPKEENKKRAKKQDLGPLIWILPTWMSLIDVFLILITFTSILSFNISKISDSVKRLNP